MTLNVTTLLKDIRDSIGIKKSAYLFGTTIRKILNGENPDQFNVFIKVHHAENKNKIFEKLPKHSKVFYTLGTSLSVSDVFTTNLLYVDIDDILNNKIEVQSFQYGLRDFNKKSIKFTKEALSNMKPEYLFRAVEITTETNFHLDMKTINTIFYNRSLLDAINKREFYKFICNSTKSNKTRKYISLCNTLGISTHLLGFEFFEHSALNHLEKSDIPELFTLLLKEVPTSHLKEVLVNCGVYERDCDYIINLSKAISQIKDESVETARKILYLTEKKRIQNISRVVRHLGYKELAKNIKSQKESQVTLEDLCVNESMIHLAFGINNQEIVAILLDKALEKIIIEPDFNNQNKLLNYLNIERKKL